MRIVLLLVLLFEAISSTAQMDFYKQVKTIIADSAGGFLKLRGQPSPKQDGIDSAFFSVLQIEGTKNNEIFKVDSSRWMYSGVIADSIRFNKAKRIADEWKEKLHAAAGGQFTVEKYKVVDYNPSKYGWSIVDKNMTISIHVFGPKDTGYIVFLSLSN